ncbi:hypothetical protein [Mangrovivirga cuniculi]|uniref:Uncharacterized protein n=1 Tax=Mangrovivirga cuniculi TaxID=2715131 RepID=A0A4D7JWL0_9BACT|nr:hypothetical protein [Mangrovivirga cuniculi]QCK15195.1 hypothetical protein DCC35_10770 [Mangrovivirga cuniculi]
MLKLIKDFKSLNLSVLALFFALTFTLASCGSGSTDSADEDEMEQMDEEMPMEEEEMPMEEEHMNDSTHEDHDHDAEHPEGEHPSSDEDGDEHPSN